MKICLTKLSIEELNQKRRSLQLILLAGLILMFIMLLGFDYLLGKQKLFGIPFIICTAIATQLPAFFRLLEIRSELKQR